MSNPNGDKGKRWEKATVDFLGRFLGRSARRPHNEGFKDVGDVHTSLFALQCKDEARHNFSGYLTDAEIQRGHAGQDYAAAVVKRRQRGAGEGYVVMTLDTFARVHARLDDAEERLRDAYPKSYAEHIETHRGVTP